MSIYTRFGDRGDTRLFDGTRVRKNHLRVRAYGEIDELNSALGVAGSGLSASDLLDLVREIQGQLMAVGAELANPEHVRAEPKARPRPEWVGGLEAAIDRLEAELPPLRRFILPGGTPSGARLHLARTVCRRAERLVVELAEVSPVSETVLGYVNRLSDLLFVLARVANIREGMEEVQW
jgi:cob(I)alamin adenosyltransferase